MKTKILKIEEIKIDKELYPRFDADTETFVRYAEAMRAGEKFPKIVVAYFSPAIGTPASYWLVDGRHRLLARGYNKETHVSVEIIDCKNKKELFIESVKRNISHGKPLTSSEIESIKLTLEDFKVNPKEICKIVKVPIDDFKPIIANSISREGSITEPEEKGITPEEAFKGYNQEEFNDGSLYQSREKRGIDPETDRQTTLTAFICTVDRFNRVLLNFSLSLKEFGNIKKSSEEGEEIKKTLDTISKSLKEIQPIIRIREELLEAKYKLERSLYGSKKDLKSTQKVSKEYLNSDELVTEPSQDDYDELAEIDIDDLEEE